MSTNKQNNVASFVDLENMPSSMEEVLKQEMKTDFIQGSILKGRVIEKRDNGVLVDIQYKSEGFIAAEEFKNWKEIKSGDIIDVYLEQIEDENHMPKLSVSKASFQRSWDKLCSEYEEGQVIKGLMKHRVKGGIICLLYTSPSPRDRQKSRMPSSA